MEILLNKMQAYSSIALCSLILLTVYTSLECKVEHRSIPPIDQDSKILDDKSPTYQYFVLGANNAVIEQSNGSWNYKKDMLNFGCAFEKDKEFLVRNILFPPKNNLFFHYDNDSQMCSMAFISEDCEWLIFASSVKERKFVEVVQGKYNLIKLFPKAVKIESCHSDDDPVSDYIGFFLKFEKDREKW